MEHVGPVTLNQIRGGLTGKPPMKSNASMNSGESYIQSPPLVVPDEIPIDIMAKHLGCNRYAVVDDPGYQVIAGHLWGYQHSRGGWDEYATRLDGSVLETMTNIFRDCRQNGFYSPMVVFRGGKKKIIFGQVVDKEHKRPVPDKIKPTLCYFCEDRRCEEDHGNGLVINMNQCRRNKP